MPVKYEGQMDFKYKDVSKLTGGKTDIEIKVAKKSSTRGIEVASAPEIKVGKKSSTPIPKLEIKVGKKSSTPEITYEGETDKTGKPDGLGIETKSGDYQYKGKFDKGDKSGIGVFRYADQTVVKIGSVENGNAYGTIAYDKDKNISSYAGQIDNKTYKHGLYGVYILKDDTQFIGQLDENGNGLGKLIWKNEETGYYLGNMKSFKPNGLGYKYSKDGDYKYLVGNFVDGALDGFGKAYNDEKEKDKDKDKEPYYSIGNFKNNKLDGLGEIYTRDTVGNYQLQKGTFVSNKLHGLGIKEWPTGNVGYKIFANFEEGKIKENANLYYDEKQKKYLSGQNDKTNEDNAKKLETSIATDVETAITNVKLAETEKSSALYHSKTATNYQELGNKNVENINKVEQDVDTAIEKLKVEKAALDFYNIGFTSGTTPMPKPEIASTGHLKIGDSKYFGQINSSNQPHGFGELTLKNDNVYKGRFNNGVKDGVGQLYDNKGNVSYSGFFKNDDKYDLTTEFTGSKDALKEVMKEKEKKDVDTFITTYVNPVIKEAREQEAQAQAEREAKEAKEAKEKEEREAKEKEEREAKEAKEKEEREKEAMEIYKEKITHVIKANYPDPAKYVYRHWFGEEYLYTGGLNADGKQQGLGKLEFSPHEFYEGTFENNKYNGIGKITFTINEYFDSYFGIIEDKKISGIGLRIKGSVEDPSTKWLNNGEKKGQENMELLKIVKDNIKEDIGNFVKNKVQPFLQKAKEKAIEEATLQFNKKMEKIPEEVKDPVYGVHIIEKKLNTVQTIIAHGASYLIRIGSYIGKKLIDTNITEFKGQLKNGIPHGYGVVFFNNSKLLEGYFEDGNIIFGTGTDKGSGFFGGSSIFDATLNGYGKTGNNHFSDTFKDGELPQKKFADDMYGENAALVEVIRDKLSEVLNKVSIRANDAVDKAMRQLVLVSYQKIPTTAVSGTAIVSATGNDLVKATGNDLVKATGNDLVKANGSELVKVNGNETRQSEHVETTQKKFNVKSQEKYDKIIKLEIHEPKHYVYQSMIDGYKYTGGVNDNGKPHGFGKQVSEKETYEGTFSNGKRQGLGKLITKFPLVKEFYGQFNNNDKNRDIEYLKADIENFVKDNITNKEQYFINEAKKYAKIEYDKTHGIIIKDFSNLHYKKVTPYISKVTGNYEYLGQVNDDGLFHGYGVYNDKNNKKIKSGIFETNNFIFGKLENVDNENNRHDVFLGFFDHGYGLLSNGNIFTDAFNKKTTDIDINAVEFETADNFVIKGHNRGFIEVIKENIEKDVEDVVKIANWAAEHVNNPLSTEAPNVSIPNSNQKESPSKKGKENEWKTTALKAAALGVGAAGVYYLYKKHKEYKQSKKSKRSKRKKSSSRSNRKTRSQKRNRPHRSRRSSQRSKSKQRDREHQSSRSSRKTRKSSQRSSE
jgi:hypothetical protein